MDPGACEIERLPADLLTHVISLTSPAVACRAAAVSPAFRAAADSDFVWSRFLPRDLPLFANKELPIKAMSTKRLFLRLADQGALLPQKFIRMHLDKATGTKCFALCARSLQFPGLLRRPWWTHPGFDPNLRGKKFLQVYVLSRLHRFEICGKLDRKMLSHNTTYGVYIVFKIAIYEFDGWDVQLDEASVSVGGRESTRRVCLGGYTEYKIGAADHHQVPPRHVLLKSAIREEYCAISDLPEDVVVSRRRADGWMELELGEFYNGDDDDGKVFMRLRDINGGTYKDGFVVWSIEIRPKHES